MTASNEQLPEESLHSNAVAYVDTTQVRDEDIILYVKGRPYRAVCWEPGMAIPEGSVVLDTETEMIVPGRSTHPVLLQAHSVDSSYVWYVPYQDIREFMQGLRALYSEGKVTRIIAHNAAFDMHILGLFNRAFFPEFHDMWVDAILDGKIEDTGLRYVLSSLADGTYTSMWNLGYVMKKVLGMEIGKEENHETRTSYRRDTVLTKAQVVYACEDVVHTGLLWKARPKKMPTEEIQIMGSVALEEISRNGMRVDREYMSRKREEFKVIQEENQQILNLFGYFRGKPGNASVAQKILRNVEERTGVELPRCNPRELKDGSIKEDIKTGAVLIEALESAFDGRMHPFCEAMVAEDSANKMLSTYLDDKYIAEDGRVHPRFTVLVRTGRTSCSEPNLQNPPRGGGIRGVYIPEDGFLYFANDYSQAELCTLAQTCKSRYGFSRMLDIINSGEDLHRWFGRKIAEEEGKDWDSLSKSEQKSYRQMAKATNFGFPGGLSPRTLVVYARQTYGVLLTIEQATRLKELWMRTFPEMEFHLRPEEEPRKGNFARRSNSDEDEEGQYYVASTLNGRVRSRCTYNSACNLPFQGLASDGAKISLFYCAVACWNSEPRCRIVNFIHDEIIFEIEEKPGYLEVCRTMSELMLAGMKEVIPDVDIKDEGSLMRRWYKEAEPVFDADGLLTVWEPVVTSE